MGTQEGRGKAYARHRGEAGSAERRAEFQKRAASVNPWTDPERDDPRAELTQEQLGGGEQAVDAAGGEAGWLVASSDWPAVG